MPLTIVERIAQELYARLEAMIGDDAYETAVCQVVRPTRFGDYTPQDKQILMTQGNLEHVPELSIPGNPPGIARRQVFNIRCHLMTDENSETPIEADINLFASDVIRAVTTPSAAWHTFDGLAIDAEIRDFEFITADGSLDGINIPVAVTYRVSEYDPTVSRI